MNRLKLIRDQLAGLGRWLLRFAPDQTDIAVIAVGFGAYLMYGPAIAFMAYGTIVLVLKVLNRILPNKGQ